MTHHMVPHSTSLYSPIGHIIQYHMMHRMVQYDASNGTIWHIIIRYCMVYHTVWWICKMHRKIPYKYLYGTVPYDTPYGTIRCTIVRNHMTHRTLPYGTIRRTIVRNSTTHHTILYDTLYATVRRTIVWNCMTHRTIPYNPPFDTLYDTVLSFVCYRTTCRTLPYDAP